MIDFSKTEQYRENNRIEAKKTQCTFLQGCVRSGGRRRPPRGHQCPRAERSYKPFYADGNLLGTYRRTKEKFQAMVRGACDHGTV